MSKTGMLTVTGAMALALFLGAADPAAAGDAGDSVGVVDDLTGEWFLLSPDGETTSFHFGNPGDVPFVGDWDCDGVDTPGLFRRDDGYVYLRDTNTPGAADTSFYFGNPGDVPLAGDFDGDGCDTVAVYRPAEARFFVINELGSNEARLGAAESDFVFGNVGDVPFVGDLDNDGIDEIGLHRKSTGFVYHRNSLTTGIADNAFSFGDGGDQLLTGDWVANPDSGPDTVGVFRPSSGAFHLKFANSEGIADEVIPYGRNQMTAVAGHFGQLPGGDDPPLRGHQLDVIAREAWGAAPPRAADLVPHAISDLTVHHAGDQSLTTGPSRYRSWQTWHMAGKGWPDISYHFIVGVDGTVYEGRDPRYRTDTFTGYDTTGHLQIVVEGNFDFDTPTTGQIDSLVRLLAWGSTTYGVEPTAIAGHGDHAATGCPGANLSALIHTGRIAADVANTITSGGVHLNYTTP